jgi:hypothetical protein
LDSQEFGEYLKYLEYRIDGVLEGNIQVKNQVALEPVNQSEVFKDKLEQLQIKVKSDISDIRLQSNVLRFLSDANKSSLGKALSEFNSKEFDDDQSGGELNSFEMEQFTNSLADAVNQIISLKDWKKFKEIHEESNNADGISNIDKKLANALDLQEIILGNEGESFSEQKLNELGLTDEELKKMEEKDFDITSSESWKELGILLAKEFGSGVEDVLRFLGNVPSGVVLVPRYTIYRFEANSDDVNVSIEADIKLKELVEDNPSLALLNLAGEQGIQMIKQMSEMITSGKQGDIAMLMVTIAGLLAGGAGAVKLAAKMGRKSAIKSARNAGRQGRTNLGRSGRNALRDTSNVAGKFGNMASKVDDIVGGAGLGHIVGSVQNKSPVLETQKIKESDQIKNKNLQKVSDTDFEKYIDTETQKAFKENDSDKIKYLEGMKQNATAFVDPQTGKILIRESSIANKPLTEVKQIIAHERSHQMMFTLSQSQRGIVSSRFSSKLDNLMPLIDSAYATRGTERQIGELVSHFNEFKKIPEQGRSLEQKKLIEAMDPIMQGLKKDGIDLTKPITATGESRVLGDEMVSDGDALAAQMNNLRKEYHENLRPILKKQRDIKSQMDTLKQNKNHKTEEFSKLKEELKQYDDLAMRLDDKYLKQESQSRNLTNNVEYQERHFAEYIKLDPGLNSRPAFNIDKFKNGVIENTSNFSPKKNNLKESRLERSNLKRKTKESIYGHGSNGYVLWTALTKTNGQLLPKNFRDKAEIPTLTGEYFDMFQAMRQRGSVHNDKNISTIDLLASRTSLQEHLKDASTEREIKRMTREYDREMSSNKILSKYANKSKKEYLVTPERIREKIKEIRDIKKEGLESIRTFRKSSKQDDSFFDMTLEDRVSSIDITLDTLGKKERNLKKLEVYFNSMSQKEKDIYEQLSQIPVVIIGDRSVSKYADGRNQSNHAIAFENETEISRLNTRAVVTDEKNISVLQDIMKKTGFDDIKVISFKEWDSIQNKDDVLNIWKNEKREKSSIEKVKTPSVSQQPSRRLDQLKNSKEYKKEKVEIESTKQAEKMNTETFHPPYLKENTPKSQHYLTLEEYADPTNRGLIEQLSGTPYKGELEAAHFPNPPRTVKLWTIKNQPGKLVREHIILENEGLNTIAQANIEGEKSFANLSEKYGVKTVNMHSVIGKNKEGDLTMFTTVDRINGEDLSDAKNLPIEAKDELGALYESFGEHFHDAWKNNTLYWADYNNDQLKYGSKEGETDKHFYVVDIGAQFFKPGEKPLHSLEWILQNTINGLVQSEAKFKPQVRLDKARNRLLEIVNEMLQKKPDDKWLLKSKSMLEDSRVVRWGKGVIWKVKELLGIRDRF